MNALRAPLCALHRARDSPGTLLLGLLLYRTLNAFLLATVFEPDEVFQCLEPAAHVLAGRGTPTWDWMLGIRSINFVALYLVPSYVPFKIGSPALAYAVPKAVNGAMAALTDFFTVRAAALYGVDALPATLLSHGLWLYAPRSHINSLETLVGIAAFYFVETFRRGAARGKLPALWRLRAFLLLMLYGAFLRPSVCLLNAVPFALCIAEVRPFRALVRLAPELCVALGALVLSDSLFYGEPIFVPLNFVDVNVFKGASRLFGAQPWCAHFFFALVLLGPTLPAFLLAARRFKALAASVALFVGFYSLLGHKEMRFLLPILPFCHIVAASRKARGLLGIRLAVLVAAVGIGLLHQNVHSSMAALRTEIAALDAQNGRAKDIRVFFCLWPYLLPTYPFLANRRVHIAELDSNPDVYARIPAPRIYRRFRGHALVVDRHGAFVADIRKNIAAFLDYDFIVMHLPYYEAVRDIVDVHFDVRRVLRYVPRVLDLFPQPPNFRTCARVYVLRHKRPPAPP